MPDNDEIEAAEEVVAEKGFKRPSEAIITFLSAAWIALVAIFDISDAQVVSGVAGAIAASSYLWGFIVDRSRM